MLFARRKILWLSVCFIVLTLQQQHGEGAKISQADLTERILKMLNKLERNNKLNINTKFSALLGEFLIKQKQRFSESTRYEEQAYYHILQKLNIITQRSDDIHLEEIYRRILGKVFQSDVLLIPPVLKSGHIDTHFEYKSLLHDYDQLAQGTDTLNSSFSDLCLAEIANARPEQCELRDDCMNVITTDLPTYGYQRTHQILLLYVLMHHKCATHFGSQAAYEILASQKCTQVYREQNVMRSLGWPVQYRDLYLEQNVLCGLFGDAEFLNWHNLEFIWYWANEDGCYCMPQTRQQHMLYKPHCSCNNHLNSLALIYYINALLMLE